MHANCAPSENVTPTGPAVPLTLPETLTAVMTC
jgi:hypothetical protein